MKVLYITHYNELYGANKSMLYLIEDMKSRYNIEPIVLCPGDGNLINELNRMSVKYYKVKNYRWMTGGKNNIIYNYIKRILNKVVLYQKAYFIIRKLNIDIVHSNSSVISIGNYLAKRLEIPHIWHLREFGESDYDLKYIYNLKRVRKIFEQSDCLIAISSAIEEYYKKLAPNANIKLIYNGINNSDYLKIAVQDVEKINFCCVGLINSNKNQMEIIKAVNYLVKKNISGFVVNIIGDGEKKYINNINDYINKNNLERYVKFWGYRNDVKEILPKMQIGIIPSRNEAFGRVTVEYMMNGLPVIGSNAGGTTEIIKNNETGFLYPLGMIEELANCMEKYILNKELREKHAKQAIIDSNNRFSMKANTDFIYSIYQKLIRS